MLCRACGGEMFATEFCPSCNEGVLWKCTACEKENDRSVHTYHPGREEISTTIPTSVVGALVCLASGFSYMV